MRSCIIYAEYNIPFVIHANDFLQPLIEDASLAASSAFHPSSYLYSSALQILVGFSLDLFQTINKKYTNVNFHIIYSNT